MFRSKVWHWVFNGNKYYLLSLILTYFLFTSIRAGHMPFITAGLWLLPLTSSVWLMYLFCKMDYVAGCCHVFAHNSRLEFPSDHPICKIRFKHVLMKTCMCCSRRLVLLYISAPLLTNGLYIAVKEPQLGPRWYLWLFCYSTLNSKWQNRGLFPYYCLEIS